MSSGSSKKSPVIILLMFLCVAGVIGVLVFVFMNPLKLDQDKQSKVLRKKIDASQAKAEADKKIADQIKAFDKRLIQMEEKISELGKIGDKIAQLEEQAKNTELIMSKIDKLEGTITSAMGRKTNGAPGAEKTGAKEEETGKEKKRVKTEKTLTAETTEKETSKKTAKKKTFKRKPAKKRIFARRKPRQPVKQVYEQQIYDTEYQQLSSDEKLPEQRAYGAEYQGSGFGEQRTHGTKYHLVSSGETLAQISRSFGMKVSELLRLNNITPGTFVYPGELLLVRPKPKRRVSGSVSSYSGGTLNQISRRYAPSYGMSQDELRSYNKLAPGLAIYPQLLGNPKFGK